jgi:DNA polymerase type B, organellar and viral
MKPLTDENPWPMFAVFDIEAARWTNLRLLCHTDEFGNRKAFTSVREYLGWLFSHSFLSDCVWAHWGGHYDSQFITAECHKLGWGFNVALSAGSMIVVTVTNAEGRMIKFCDSSRIMPDSVKKIGESVGLHKLDADRRDIDSLTWDEMLTYCYRDCDIIVLGLQKMRAVLQPLGVDFAFTLASMCTRFIRRSQVLDWYRFYEKDPDNPGKMMTSKAFLEGERFCYWAYAGGRTEVFKTGVFKGPLYYYDITSSYPWSMTHELPAYPVEFGPPPKGSIEQQLDRCGVSEVIIHIPLGALKYPTLHYRHDGKLLFPAGRMLGRWTNIELAYTWNLIKHHPRAELEILGQQTYQPLAFMRPFIMMFWELRKAALESGDVFAAYAYKIAMNSAGGKLGEMTEKTSILFGSAVQEAMRRHGKDAVEWMGLPGIYKLIREELGPFRHIAAGAYMTGRSRMLLHQGMMECWRARANVYYCDTDSIITDKPVFGHNKVKTLGAWHLENVLDEAELWLPKVYRLVTSDGKVIHKAKGMPIDRPDDAPGTAAIRWNQFVAAFHGENLDKPEKEGLLGFRANLARARRQGLSHIDPTALPLKRSAVTRDTKRVHDNQGDSNPHYLVGPEYVERFREITLPSGKTGRFRSPH